MARRKAPRRRRREASEGSSGTAADHEAAGEVAGSSRDLCTEVDMMIMSSVPSSDAQGPAKWHDNATDIARTVFSLTCHLAGALLSLWRHLLSMCLFAVQKMALQKKRFLQVIFLLLPVALAAVYCGTSLPAWTMWAKGLLQKLPHVFAAHLNPAWNCCVLMEEQSQKMQLFLEQEAQLRAEISSLKQELEEVKQAVFERASEVHVDMSDWALQSSGASIVVKGTSETYDCKEDWVCRFFESFRPPRTPDLILQPDVSPRNCWPFPGHQGQVVIRLPARVHLTAVTVQHISKEASPLGTVTSAPRDIAVFGVDADGEEETLLETFMYDVAKEAIQTFPLKNAPLPRAFACVKLVVKSNWGKPQYTCIYRVQVHGKMAKPDSLS